MINGLKPYPKMKDSGVEWLGDVPEHWEIRRLKSSVRNVNEQTSDRQTGERYIALEHVESWTGRLMPADPDTAFESQVKRFRSGDVLFGKLRPYLAKVALPTCDGVCVGEFLVLRPNGADCSSPYLEQLLRSKPIIDAVNSSTFGAKMPRADWQFVGTMDITFPPPLEQAAIVRFLEYADRRIRRYIRAKQKLIKLLEEQKQAIIHQAVTRGLDPNVRLKPSGVEWLGDVPEHWGIRRLKSICSMKSGDGITATTIEKAGVYPVYGGNGIRGYTSRYTHQGEFALIGRQGALCGNVHLASGTFWASEHAVVVTLGKFNNLKWFAELLRTMNLNQYSFAAAQPGLAVERILNLSIPYPPFSDQDQIAAHIEEATSGLVETVQKLGHEISLLREYRTRLIADVVTGKLDVRAAAANLPDELEEPDLPDETTLEADTDESVGDEPLVEGLE